MMFSMASACQKVIPSLRQPPPPPPPPPYCIFCLKENSTNEGNGGCGGLSSPPPGKYATIQRFLGVPFNNSASSGGGGGGGGGGFRFQFCRDCVLLVDKLEELLGALSRIQMELEGEIGSIKKTVEEANRIPARVAFVRRYYSEMGKEEVMMGQAEQWRRQFVRKSTAMLRNLSHSQGSLNEQEGRDSCSGVEERDDADPIKEELMDGDDFNNDDSDPAPFEVVHARSLHHDDHNDDDDTSASVRQEDFFGEPKDIESSRADMSEEQDELALDPIKNEVASTGGAGRGLLRKSRRLPSSKFRYGKCRRTFSSQNSLDSHKESHHDDHHDDKDNSDSEAGDDDPDYSEGDDDISPSSDKDQDEDSSELEEETEKESAAVVKHPSFMPFLPPLRRRPAPADPLSGDEPERKDESKFSCSICKSVFPTKVHLRRHHQRNHDKGKAKPGRKKEVIKCDVAPCSAYFLLRGQLDRHRQLFHSIRNIKKGGRPSNFSGRGGRPTVQHVDEYKLKPHPCTICGMGFDTLNILAGHFKSHHDTTPSRSFDCPEVGCSAYFLSSLALRKHQLSAHGKTSKGSTENMTTSQEPEVQNEADSDEVEERFPCPICKISFSYPHILKGHQQTHHVPRNGNDPVFRCEEAGCGAWFVSSIQLAGHRVRLHMDIGTQAGEVKEPTTSQGDKPVDTKPHTTPHGGEEKRRKKIKEGEPSHQCKLCKVTTGSSWELVSHFKHIHDVSDMSPAQVQRCDATPSCPAYFRTKQQLDIHKRREHGVVKPARTCICEQCGKGFRDNNRLLLHLKSHSGPDSWDFQCPECGKRCLTKSALKLHSRIHTGEKPYCCEHCGMAYAHRVSWRQHVKKEHSVEGPQKAKKRGPKRKELSACSASQQVETKLEQL